MGGIVFRGSRQMMHREPRSKFGSIRLIRHSKKNDSHMMYIVMGMDARLDVRAAGPARPTEKVVEYACRPKGNGALRRPSIPIRPTLAQTSHGEWDEGL